MSAAQEFAQCAFCDRVIGMQGGRIRPHKFDDDVPICPGSDLSATDANELFKRTLRTLVQQQAPHGATQRRG